MKQPKIFIKHIMEEIKYLFQNSVRLEYKDFIKDETRKRSFVRSLEIIGEATKNLPEDFRNKYPELPWKEMAGLRDILIHQYFGIDYRFIWDITKNKIPKLKEQIEEILKDTEES